MANLLEELPKIQRKGAGGRRGSKYPLDEWFNGQVWALEQGTAEQVEKGEADYDAKTSSIVNMLHTQASAKGLKLTTRKMENGVALVALPGETNGHTETETKNESTEAKSTKK